MSNRWTRRNWCRALMSGPALLAGCRPAVPWWQWRGLAFGTEVSIGFAPALPAEAPRLSGLCSREVKRLESLFSLFDENSALRRLNRDGFLDSPPGELLEALEICRALHRETDGAFDVTVQPLWELFEMHYRGAPESRGAPPAHALRQVLEKVDFRAVEFGVEQVRFRKPGMAVTLNGMIQGFVTDRVADLLLDAGVGSALIHLGEYRAIGSAPDGTAWNIAVRGAAGAPVGMVALEDRALAISSGSGWMFGTDGRFHHIFHPTGGEGRPPDEILAVATPTAAWADGLATAGLLISPDSFGRLMGRQPWPAEFWRFSIAQAGG